jgi:hypothetical protein
MRISVRSSRWSREAVVGEDTGRAMGPATGFRLPIRAGGVAVARFSQESVRFIVCARAVGPPISAIGASAGTSAWDGTTCTVLFHRREKRHHRPGGPGARREIVPVDGSTVRDDRLTILRGGGGEFRPQRQPDDRSTPRRHADRLIMLASILVMFFSSSGTMAQISPGPLSRAHAELEGTLNCLKCHGAGRSAVDDSCLDCHKAIAWLIDEGRGLHGREGRSECASCHPEHAGVDFELILWEEGSPEQFDHARTGWALEGKHASRACRDCHKPELHTGRAGVLLEKTARADSWLGLETDCRSCHDDAHRGALGSDCVRCHGMEGWKPAPRFDHQRTTFPLTGKHAPVTCDKCHLDPDLPLTTDAKGKLVPIYKPVPHQECSACHDDPHKGKLGAACGGCHDAVAWSEVNRQEFDHSRTRYPLKGRHASLRCEACHDPDRAWGKKPPMETCGACHKDPHAGKATLAGKSTDCAACHDESGFRPSTYTVADHDRAPYPLEGKHRDVKCEGCHPRQPEGMPVADLGKAGVLLRRAHERCMDCHADPHGGQLEDREDGGACESCHRVDGWKPSLYGIEQHAALALPLDGRHGEVGCAACHGPERPGLPPFPADLGLGKAGVALTLLPSGCETCHPDPHRGRFSPGGDRPASGGCTACHDARSFVPSTIDVAAHDGYAFPLEKGHRAVPCIDCHKELAEPPSEVKLVASGGTPRELTFRASHERCSDCHRSPHGEQFAGRPDAEACTGCHDQEAFRPASRFDHATARFPLEGAHARVACDRCHPATSGPDGREQVIYRPLPGKCQDCHKGRTFAPDALSGDGSGADPAR